MEGILDTIMGGVEKIVGADTVKQFSPAIVAAIQSKLAKTPEVLGSKAPPKVKAAPKPKATSKDKAATSPGYLPAPKTAGLPKWVIPAAIAGVGLLVVGAVVKMKGKKNA
jgi:hypothetical protein